jgi:DNA-binding protein H-NS
MKIFSVIVNTERCISLKLDREVMRSAEVEDGLFDETQEAEIDVLNSKVRLSIARIRKRGVGMGETVESLEGLNDTQLRDLVRNAEMMLRERGAKRIEELKQLAKEAGYDVTLTKIGEKDGRGRRGRGAAGKRERGDRRREVSAKYQNPDDPSVKWSGRGRKPKWVEMALSHGGKLEDLAIAAG